ncbi:MAG TPA: hypothetical protein VLA97_10935 [Nocardioidaceae bacterium]|nr:hypothetical protein [Nocardioidaceae bacterium]
MTTSAEFFALVDRHVTGPIAAVGYARIGGSDEWSDSSRPVPLRAVHSTWSGPRRWPGRIRSFRLLSPRGGSPDEHVFTVGYEGGERGEDDEKWVRYYPDSNELDIRDWSGALVGHADWAVRNNLDVTEAEELERRLQVLGRAHTQR